MTESTFKSVDWEYVESREDVPWFKYAHYAFSKDSPEHYSFKKLYDERYPSGSKGIYYPKYVQIIAKAKFLKII